MLKYPLVLTPDSNGTYLVTSVDLPEVSAVAKDEADALANGIEAIETALEIYFDARRPVPLPSEPENGQLVITLPVLEAAKVLLWNEMFSQKLRKADLARRLNVHTPQVDRLFDLNHSSKIEFVEQAAKALGKSLSITLV